MDTSTDSILTLLQDIKNLLFGIALLLLGVPFTILGLLLGGWWALLLFVSLPVLLAGLLYIWHGWHAHEVVEKSN